MINAPALRRWPTVLIDITSMLKGVSGYSFLAIIGLGFGFIRELVVASQFGLSADLDVFVAVMSIHVFFGVQIGNSIEAAFISKVPRSSDVSVLVTRLTQTLSSLVLLNAVIVLLLVVTSDVVLKALFPGFDAHQHRLGIRMIQFLLLPIAFTNMAGLLRSGLNVLSKFAPGFFAGTVVSVMTIISVLAYAPHLGVDALVLGYAAGHFLVLVIFAARLIMIDEVVVVRSNWTGSGMWFLWGSAGAVLMGEIFYQTVILTERSLAATLPSGSIAAFYYASTIVSVPLSLFVVPLTTTLFPSLVELFKEEPREALGCLLKHGVLIMGLGLVVAATVSNFARPIVEAIFVRGHFTVEDAAYTAGILAVTVWALPFVSLGRLLKTSCYSLQEYRGPALAVGAQAVALLSLGLVLIPRFGAFGLAVAYLCAEATMMMAMGLSLSRRLGKL